MLFTKLFLISTLLATAAAVGDDLSRSDATAKHPATAEQRCARCHGTGGTAAGKPADHLPTSEYCAACHYSLSHWLPVSDADFDHAHVDAAGCEICHDERRASGRPAGHLGASQDCAACHRSDDWRDTAPDHGAFNDDCIACHDGETASGKPSDHIRSGEQCQRCHDRFPGHWAPLTAARVDHDVVQGRCIACHNGHIASGKAVTHANTSDACERCHPPAPAPWAPFFQLVDHEEVPPGYCAQCHRIYAQWQDTVFSCGLLIDKPSSVIAMNCSGPVPVRPPPPAPAPAPAPMASGGGGAAGGGGGGAMGGGGSGGGMGM